VWQKEGKKHLCSPLAFTSLPLLKSRELALSKPFMLFSVLKKQNVYRKVFFFLFEIFYSF